MHGYVVPLTVFFITVSDAYITALIIDCDDDGEAAAGGRLAHLLALMVCNRKNRLHTGP